MKKIIQRHLLLFLPLLCILMIAIVLINHTYANRDAVWLLSCGHELLNGKKYFYDFFETNPPLIIFFYMPAIFLAKTLPVSEVAALNIYIFAWLIFALLLCYILLHKSLQETQTLIPYLMIALTACFSILPFFWFSEREHCATFLTMPYFLLMTCRLQNQSISKSFAVLIGLLAAIGFSMKPYFLAPLVLIELYYLFYQKRFFAWIKIESIVILLFMITYLLSTIFFFPEYFTKVLPMTTKLYIPAFDARSISFVLFSLFSFYLIATVIFSLFILLFSRAEKNSFVTIFMLAVLGFWIAYVYQAREWYYHALPGFTVSIFLLFFIFINSFKYIAHAKRLKDLNLLQLFISFIAITLIYTQVTLAILCNLPSFVEKKDHTNAAPQLISYIQQHAANQNVLIISSWFLKESITYYTNAHVIGRFPSMLLIPGIEKLKQDNNQAEYLKMKKDFFNLLMEDIQRNPPQLIVIEKLGYWLFYDNGEKIQRYQFLPFLLSDPDFTLFFKQYYLTANTSKFLIYKKK